jgi:hypothetical protein
MSEVQKPVEAETVAPVEAAPVVAEPVHAPVAAESAPVAPVTESNGDVIEPAAATDAPAVEKVAEPAKFAGEGVLGYKAPGGNFLRYVLSLPPRDATYRRIYVVSMLTLPNCTGR